MDDRELEILLQDLESDRVERKSSIAERDKIRQAICAFANDLPDHRQPGVVFVGLNDDGSCAHLAITESTTAHPRRYAFGRRDLAGPYSGRAEDDAERMFRGGSRGATVL